MNKKILHSATAILILFSTPVVLAAGASNEWSDAWTPPSSQARTVQLLQADLIEKMEGDYYDGFTTNLTVNSYSSVTTGVLMSGDITTNITGNYNNVDAYNNGDSTGVLTSNIGLNSSIQSPDGSSITNIDSENNCDIGSTCNNN